MQVARLPDQTRERAKRDAMRGAEWAVALVALAVLLNGPATVVSFVTTLTSPIAATINEYPGANIFVILGEPTMQPCDSGVNIEN